MVRSLKFRFMVEGLACRALDAHVSMPGVTLSGEGG